MKVDKTRIYLWVQNYGEDASVVTQSLGLKPTYVKIPGQPNPLAPKMLSRIHSWEFHSPLAPTAHLNEHFEALLGLLEPHASAIKTVSRSYMAGINCVLEYEDWTPGFHLSAPMIKLLADMDLSIDFDVYFFAE